MLENQNKPIEQAPGIPAEVIETAAWPVALLVEAFPDHAVLLKFLINERFQYLTEEVVDGEAYYVLSVYEGSGHYWRDLKDFLDAPFDQWAESEAEYAGRVRFHAFVMWLEANALVLQPRSQ